MNAFRKLTRRSFLRLTAWLGACLFSPFAWASQEPRNTTAIAQIAEKLVGSVSKRRSAEIVGLEYLRRVPREADVSLLVDLICSSTANLRSQVAYANKREVRALLSHQHRQDFERGRMVNVRGWMLSETEARLCALVALV